jgi:Insulinase (Peptidase family M16)
LYIEVKMKTATRTFLIIAGLSSALAFQTSCPTIVDSPSSSSSTATPATCHNHNHPYIPVSPQASSPSRLLQSTSDHSHVDLSDADGQRRRHLLFSMLYGSATALVGGGATPEEAIAAQTTVETTTTTTTTLPPPPPVSTGILRPPKDDREYLAYTLDNGLRVLLCSDPATNEAAAALDVHVGACSDPDQVPGMAHFCGKS